MPASNQINSGRTCHGHDGAYLHRLLTNTGISACYDRNLPGKIRHVLGGPLRGWWNTCAIKERVPPEREFPIVILKVLEGYSVNNGDLIGHSERRAEILKYAGESESVLSLPLHTRH